MPETGRWTCVAGPEAYMYPSRPPLVIRFLLARVKGGMAMVWLWCREAKARVTSATGGPRLPHSRRWRLSREWKGEGWGESSRGKDGCLGGRKRACESAPFLSVRALMRRKAWTQHGRGRRGSTSAWGCRIATLARSCKGTLSSWKALAVARETKDQESRGEDSEVTEG